MISIRCTAPALANRARDALARAHGAFARSCGASAMLLLAAVAFGTAAQAADVKRGEYLAAAGGCLGCHTADNGTPYAGGRPLQTPFGTFYGPNITPHAQAGIGRWSEADFFRAMREGVRPDGQHYFPSFPYPSFSAITDADLRDLWAWLRALPPSDKAAPQHELRFPFGWRFLLAGWKWMFFRPGAMHVPGSPALARGAYLAQALGHCGECHTPRNALGGPNRDRLFAGTRSGPDGKSIPNLTPARMKKWDDRDLREFLLSGMTPDGDVTAEKMGEVVRNTTGKLTPDDLSALIAFLRSLPAIPDDPK